MARPLLRQYKRTTDFMNSIPKLKSTASIDAMSAVCLLERYLEDQGEGSLPAIACSYPPPRDLMFFNYNIGNDLQKWLFPIQCG